MALTVPRYTIADLDHFPDDGNWYELLDGVLLVTPAPNSPHQGVAAWLTGVLVHSLLLPGHAKVFAPGAISFPLRTQLEPDVLVVPGRFSIQSTWPDITEHWLAVEILSPSSRIYDRDFKRDAYLALGVCEVWLVDMEDRCVEVCRERGHVEIVCDVLTWRTPVPGIEVTVDLHRIFGEFG